MIQQGTKSKAFIIGAKDTHSCQYGAVVELIHQPDVLSSTFELECRESLIWSDHAMRDTDLIEILIRAMNIGLKKKGHS